MYFLTLSVNVFFFPRHEVCSDDVPVGLMQQTTARGCMNGVTDLWSGPSLTRGATVWLAATKYSEITDRCVLPFHIVLSTHHASVNSVY